MTTTMTGSAPQPECPHCKRSRRIHETYSDNGVRRERYVHLAEGGGFVDCAIQEMGKLYDHRNKGVSRG